jgi:transcriptional regulator with XRE-family HTH domain
VYQPQQQHQLDDKNANARLCDRRSLREICDAVDMSPQNWYRIEKEQQTMSLELLRKIESVLNVNFDVHIEGWNE